MAQYRWYDVLNEITKVEIKYNIKNPNWDNGFPGVFHDYGFVPVDAHGNWWTRIPDAPELPIIYAPVVNTSYTIPTGIGTTTTTGLIDTVYCIGDGTFTELPTGETVAKVTTGGVATSVSSAVGTAAVGAAVGFGVGVGWFEAKPEFWTNVSNAVFGTDLDPAEIGQMARDTNALVVIKDGIVYMAEDMINAIRNAFFDNGANTSEVFPTPEQGQEVTINSWGNIHDALAAYGIEDLLKGRTFTDPQYAQALTDFMTAEVGGSYWVRPTVVGGKTTQIMINILAGVPEQSLPYTCVPFLIQDGTSSYYEIMTTDNKHLPLIEDYRGEFTIDLSNNILTGYFVHETTRLAGRMVYGVGNPEPNLSVAVRSSLVGSVGVESVSAVPGITPTGEQGTKDQPLAVLFPDWVSRGIETIAGDGVTKVKWLPVSLPSNKPLVDGIPFNTTEAQQGTLPDNYTETASQLGEHAQDQTKNAPSYPTPPISPIPDVTPTPDDPAIAGGGGSSTGLANLYNPTLAQVKQFSRWLWGSDGLNLDQLKKLLQDPMQAIIGLHVMYATPTTGANRDIQVGYINSGVPSKIVTEQYTEIDCGTVTINEYFGDARDYSPFTQVYCYLPFIGIVELNADDVVNSTLGIKYKIDVLTGCCLAQLTVKKYGLDAVLYTYTGNCAVQMPITSGNYLSTVSSLLGAVVSGAAAVATGGALAPVAIGAAANAMGGGARASVAMSGSLGSNAGAMGIRKPYLIIKRVESADANGYNEFYGYPTNKRVNLSQLTGYVRVKEINLSGTNATEDEQNEIVTLLKEGVIL